MGGMPKHIVKRFIQMVVTIFIVVTLNFFLFRLIPGDPIRMLFFDPRITVEQRESLKIIFGLDKPLFEQFLNYIANTFKGELGISFVYRQPVMEILSERFLNTLILVGTATVFAIIIGIFLGVIAAWRHRSRLDIGILSFVLSSYATPTFVVAMLMMLAFGGLFPVTGMSTPGYLYSSKFLYIKDLGFHMFLPVITLSLALLGQYTLIMRNSLTNVLVEDYITVARAKGLPENKVLWRHAIPNASLPLITVIAINVAIIVGGAIQTETVFAWPGLGRLIYDSLMKRDYPCLQGAFLLITITVVAANFVADLIYSAIDPRIRDR